MKKNQNTHELQMMIPYRRVWHLNQATKDKASIASFYQSSLPFLSIAGALPVWRHTISNQIIWFSLCTIALLLSVSNIHAQDVPRAKQPEMVGKPSAEPKGGLEVSLITPFPILVRGRVVDHFGNGIKGALVHVMVKGAKVSAVTDADGNYSIELEGGYKYGSIQIAADNFRTTEKEINLQDFSAIGTLVPIVTKMELLEDDLIKAIRPGMKVNGTVR